MRRTLLVILLGLGVPGLAGQAPAATPGTILFPAAMKPWSSKMAVGVSFIGMPAAIVLEANAIRWPLFDFTYVLGLPRHFTLATAVSTEVITNHFEVTPRWSVNLTDRLHADAGLGVAYWFGQLKQAQFNTNVHGWFAYPSASLGYDFGTMALTAQAKANIATSLWARSGDLVGQSATNLFSGMSYRLALEQPFSGHTAIGLALQVSHLKFYYPQWPLFPTFDHAFWIPEVQVRVTL